MNQFRDTQVVMLPAKNASHIHFVFKDEYEEINNKLVKLEQARLLFTKESTKFGYPPQHLYIVNDDEIKEDDWIIWQNKIVKAINTAYHSAKKVIATTDASLTIKHTCECFATTYEGCSQCLETLPQLSKEWIEYYISEYNKGNRLKEVLVEYKYSKEYVDELDAFGYDKQVLKINIDNTINIKPAKDNWNREEVILNIKKFYKEYKFSGINIDKWIKENL